jgi:hypothetical protein
MKTPQGPFELPIVPGLRRKQPAPEGLARCPSIWTIKEVSIQQWKSRTQKLARNGFAEPGYGQRFKGIYVPQWIPEPLLLVVVLDGALVGGAGQEQMVDAVRAGVDPPDAAADDGDLRADVRLAGAMVVGPFPGAGRDRESGPGSLSERLIVITPEIEITDIDSYDTLEVVTGPCMVALIDAGVWKEKTSGIPLLLELCVSIKCLWLCHACTTRVENQNAEIAVTSGDTQ